MRFNHSVLIIAVVVFQDYFASAHDERNLQRNAASSKNIGVTEKGRKITTRRVRRLRGNVKPEQKLNNNKHMSTKAPSTSTKAPTTSTKAPSTSTKAPTTSTKAPTAPTCTLKAHLGFPLWQDPDDAPYYGVNSDLLKVSYSDLDFCTAYWTLQPWCRYTNTNISGEGKGAAIRNDDDYYGESELDHVQEEMIEITGAAGKTTTFTVSHQTVDPWPPIIYYRNKEYNDHMLTATLTITNESKESVGISDEQGNGAWRYPTKGDVPPELENGDANPAFVGEFSIYVTCDNQCDCEAHDYTVPSDAPTPSPTDSPTLSPTTSSPVASCTLVAELGYPNYYDPDDAEHKGFNRDYLEVWYGADEYCDAWITSPSWCSYENTNATGKGAHIGNVDDNLDDYYQDWVGIQSEKFTITGAANKTIRFYVYRWFYDNDYFADLWNDHMLAATLSILNEVKGEMVRDEDGEEGWQYPVDIDTPTHIDGKINEEYGGMFKIVVTCDEACECYAHNYATPWNFI